MKPEREKVKAEPHPPRVGGEHTKAPLSPGELELLDRFAGLALAELMRVSLARMDRNDDRQLRAGDTMMPDWDFGDAEQWAEGAYVVAYKMLEQRRHERFNAELREGEGG